MVQRQPRYWTKNNVMQIHVLKQVTSHRYNTQILKIMHGRFNRKFYYDNVIQIKK